MRTSPTSPIPRRGLQAGFTLVELMVVLLIVGLAAGAVLLAIPDPQGSLAAEAERFAARARAVRDQAVIEGRATAIRVDASGYAASRRVRGEWVTDARFDWAERTRPAWDGEGRSLFDAAGTAEPLRVTLERGGRSAAVAIGPDGSVHVQR